MSDTEEQYNDELAEVELPKEKKKRNYTKPQLTEEQKQKRLEILAKAREKANEKKRLLKEAGLSKMELKKKEKEKENEELKKKIEENKIAEEEEEEDEEVVQGYAPKRQNEVEKKPKKQTIMTAKKGNKKKKKVVVYEESDSSDSEEEIVYKKRNKYKNVKQPRYIPQYEFTAEEKEELKQKELEKRLAMRKEYDEISRLEDEQLKRQYKQKLNEMRMSQLKGFLIPECNFRRK